MEESNPAELLRGPTFRTILTNLAILAFGMGSSIQLSRWLGPAGRGDIAAAMLWPVLLAYIVSMGLISAVMYFAAQPGTQLEHLAANAAVVVLAQAAVGISVGYCIMRWVLHSQSPDVVRMARFYLSG